MKHEPHRGGARLYRSGRGLAYLVLGLLLLIRMFDPSPIASFRLKLFDLYQRLAPAESGAPPVVIVDIDDASLARFGQWPWPRSLIARLIERLAEADARLVGMDVLFPEPDRLNARGLLDSMPSLDPEVRRAVESLPDGDRMLAASFHALPVVLGTAIDARAAPPDGLEAATGATQMSPLIEQGGDPRPFLPHFDRLVRNLDMLTNASAGTGVVSLSLESDGVVRRIPTVIEVGGAVLPTLALEMVRVAGGGGALMLRTGGQGLQAVGVDPIGAAANGTKGLILPTDRRGRVWIHYAASQPERFISAAKLLDGDFIRERISGRLVLIGATAAGLMDLHPTPLGIPMSGVEIHAQLLENLLTGRILTRPALATIAELALLIALGLGLVFVQPRVSNGWLLTIWAGSSLTVLCGAWIAYAAHSVLVDGLYPVFSATVIYMIAVATAFVTARRRAEARLRQREAHLRALQAELLDVSRRSVVAQLSSALAHELNQPLSAIGNYVQACRRMLISADGQASERIYGYMDRAVGQVDRAAAIITGLRDIVEKGHTARAAEEINPVLEEAAATALLGRGPAQVALRQRYAGKLPLVLINRIQIQQVVLNLVRNAVEAMAATAYKTLTIATQVADDGSVEVSIRDNGPGLAPEIEARLFRPVASSKDAGMGIGLSICRTIIEAHGGRIWATRNQEGGMTFHFTLPPAADAD